MSGMQASLSAISPQTRYEGVVAAEAEGIHRSSDNGSVRGSPAVPRWSGSPYSSQYPRLRRVSSPLRDGPCRLPCAVEVMPGTFPVRAMICCAISTQTIQKKLVSPRSRKPGISCAGCREARKDRMCRIRRRRGHRSPSAPYGPKVRHRPASRGPMDATRMPAARNTVERRQGPWDRRAHQPHDDRILPGGLEGPEIELPLAVWDRRRV